MARYSTGLKAFKLEGVPELVKTLKAIKRTLNTEETGVLAERVRACLLKPMEFVRDEAKSMAPVKTGRLRNAITAAPSKTRPGAACWVDKSQAPYAFFVEHGTSRVPAQPYFRPAVRASRPIAAKMLAQDLPGIIAASAKANRWTAPK